MRTGISAKATFPLVLLFQLAVPSEIPGYVLGALRYHFGKYLAARAIAGSRSLWVPCISATHS